MRDKFQQTLAAIIEKRNFKGPMNNIITLNSSTTSFFLDLLDMFKYSDPITSTSKQIATQHGKAERTIQLYVKTLKDCNLLHVRPIWNNDNPLKPYIERNQYHLTSNAHKLIQKAKNISDGEKNVFFNHKRPGFNA